MDSNKKILIVEDEIMIADYIFNILTKEGYKNVKMAHKQTKAEELIKNFSPEIILMDINLNGENSGIELAKTKNKEATVIFLTGQNDVGLMSRALLTNPESYLSKPIRKEDVIAAIKLSFLKKKSETVTFKDGYSIIKVNHDEILFIKSDNNYIDIQTTYKKYTIRKSLDKMMEEINSLDFVKIHRSYIVNKSKIQKKTLKSVHINQYEIPMSKSHNLEF
jgi:DNA-binding LytR/AlgR family response regulator